MDNNQLLNELKINRNAKPTASGLPVWVWIVGALVALIILFAGWRHFAGSKAISITSETVVAPSAQTGTTSVLDATGYVTARRIATVSSKITGKVKDVLIDEGMRVEAGQILATLDDSEALVDLRLARAQADAANLQLRELQVNRNNADKEAKRQADLWSKKLVAQAAYDNARASAEGLQARQASTAASLRVAQDRVAQAQQQVDNHVVRAPFAGVIIAKSAQPGEMVSPLSAGGGFTRTGIGTIVDMDSLEIQVDVNESFINRVQPGQPIEAILNAYPDWKIPAEVIAIIPTADRAKATVKVRIKLNEKDARVVPDMGVKVSFLNAKTAETDKPIAPPKGVLINPDNVVERGGKKVVFVIKDNTAKLREVELGETFNGRQQILQGLSAGEQLIVTPSDDVQDGSKITTGN
jgi:RND family efflux transporter MFP subunit